MLVTWKHSVDGKFYFLDTRSAWVGGGDFGFTEKEVCCSFEVKIKNKNVQFDIQQRAPVVFGTFWQQQQEPFGPPTLL